MSGPVLLGLRIFAAIALYVFLIGALLLLWRSVQQQILLLNQQQIAHLNLIINFGNGVDELRSFSSPEILIGRSQECDIILTDGTASAQHARISFRQGQWWVEDWESKNGTRLNDEILLTAAVITNGDIIQCGQSKILIK